MNFTQNGKNVVIDSDYMYEMVNLHKHAKFHKHNMMHLQDIANLREKNHNFKAEKAKIALKS